MNLTLLQNHILLAETDRSATLTAASDRRRPNPYHGWVFVVLLVLVLAAGVFVRIYPSAKFTGVGFDENLYRVYVNTLWKFGLSNYPDLTESYIVNQSGPEMALLPPTRFLYIGCAAAWGGVFNTSALGALKAVSCLFSVLTFALSSVIGWRVAGRKGVLALGALMAAAPTEIHLAQHAMIDGFFAFWALLTVWSLWECLRTPDRAGWQALYAGALAAMVLTKENAFFVFLGVLGLLLVNRWLRFGRVTPRLLLLTFGGPLLGAVMLLFLAGGVVNVVTVYRLLGAKAHTLEYAIRTGDGPWYRYLLDLLMISPLTLLLAIGGVFRLRRGAADAAAWFALAFIVLSYVPMANVQYAMNLRYATMWNLPLRGLAMVGLSRVVTDVAPARWRTPLLAWAVAALCLFDLHQYHVFFVDTPLYELVPEGLLRALKILK